jgi:DnaK suppressor protein
MAKTRRPLKPEEIESFKREILRQREELWNQVKQDLIERVGEEYQDLINTVKDEEELAQIDLNEETVLGVLEARKNELEAMSQALWRIEHGEFGKCLECGQWICLERLKVRPWAVFCLECKEKMEKIQRV